MFRAVLWRALALWVWVFVVARSNAIAQQEHADLSEPDEANVGPQPEAFEGDAWGDEAPNLHAGSLSFRMLVQGRQRSTFARHSRDARPDYAEREDVLLRDDDGFALQRFYLRIAAEPSPWLKLKTLIDLAKLGGARVSNVVKQAYVELRPIPERVELAVGVFKVPYSIIELDPVARYELSELGDTDDLIEALGFGGRDVGVELMLAPLPKPKWLHVLLGTFRGHARDEQASPFGTLAARLESKPWKGLRIGVDVSAMPRATDYKRLLDTADRELARATRPAVPARGTLGQRQRLQRGHQLFTSSLRGPHRRPHGRSRGHRSALRRALVRCSVGAGGLPHESRPTGGHARRARRVARPRSRQ
jgi:hypothetical protein